MKHGCSTLLFTLLFLPFSLLSMVAFSALKIISVRHHNHHQVISSRDILEPAVPNLLMQSHLPPCQYNNSQNENI